MWTVPPQQLESRVSPDEMSGHVRLQHMLRKSKLDKVGATERVWLEELGGQEDPEKRTVAFKDLPRYFPLGGRAVGMP